MGPYDGTYTDDYPSCWVLNEHKYSDYHLIPMEDWGTSHFEAENCYSLYYGFPCLKTLHAWFDTNLMVNLRGIGFKVVRYKCLKNFVDISPSGIQLRFIKYEAIKL